MSDQDQDNAKIAAVPAPASTAAAPAPALTETLQLSASPTVPEIIRLMAKAANFLNMAAGELLRTRVVTASNPATVGLMQAAANLEQGAQAQQQQVMMQQAQAFGGGPQGGPQGVPPYRMN